MPASFAVFFLGTVLLTTLAGALPMFILALYLAMSAIAFIAYGFDKSAARRQQPRIRERTLHAFSLAGGWPGALLAQAAFRHKTKKQPFQWVFWLSVLVNGALLAAYLFVRQRGMAPL